MMKQYVKNEKKRQQFKIYLEFHNLIFSNNRGNFIVKAFDEKL